MVPHFLLQTYRVTDGANVHNFIKIIQKSIYGTFMPFEVNNQHLIESSDCKKKSAEVFQIHNCFSLKKKKRGICIERMYAISLRGRVIF